MDAGSSPPLEPAARVQIVKEPVIIENQPQHRPALFARIRPMGGPRPLANQWLIDQHNFVFCQQVNRQPAIFAPLPGGKPPHCFNRRSPHQD